MKFDRQELRKLRKDQLIDIIFDLAERLEVQEKRIEALERAAARSAAPFSKGKGKQKKKKPGRKKGKGLFVRREEPQARLSDRVEVIKVPLKSPICPQCEEPLEIKIEVASTIDTPEEPQRVIKSFEVEVGECPNCGTKVRGEHPDLPVDQLGASAHRVGEKVMAQAFTLHYHGGMTLRKAADAIGVLTDISIT